MATWTLTPDGQWYQALGKMLISADGSGVALIAVQPDGSAVGTGFTAIDVGPPGDPPDFLAPEFTPLAAGDATPASLTQVVVTPRTSTTAGVYKWVIALHEGAKGDDGDTVLDPADFPGAVAGQTLAVKSDLSAFELVTPKFAERCIPGTVNNTGTGNVNSTLAVVAIPSRPWARRVRPRGYTVVTGESSDVRVDLVARLNTEASGNIVGRCTGIAQTERLNIAAGPPAGSADTFDTIAANTAGTVYFRTERQSGSVTYTTSGSTSLFSVETIPV